MSLLESLKKIFFSRTKNAKYVQMLDGTIPIYSNYGTNIYANDVVQQAINCIVNEIKKLKPLHVKENGVDVEPIRDSLQNVLNCPNDLCTTCEFLEKIMWQLFLKYNVFIIPNYYESKINGKIKRNYISLLPVQDYVSSTFIEDLKGNLFVRFKFPTEEFDIKYQELIHLRLNFSVDEFMGGDKNGQPDNSVLLKTLQINDEILTGISKATKSSYAINGVVKVNSLIDDGKAEKALKRLETMLAKSQSGFAVIDNKNEFIPMKKEVALVDDRTLKFIDEKILRYFGVPLPILTGDYTKEQYEAFYQKTLEPIIIQLSQEFSRVLLTNQEYNAGHRVHFYPKDLIFMSVPQKLEVIRMFGDSGTLYENEKRVAFGWMPLPELAGKRMQSLNYVDVNDAKKYQIGEETGGNKENE